MVGSALLLLDAVPSIQIERCWTRVCQKKLFCLSCAAAYYMKSGVRCRLVLAKRRRMHQSNSKQPMHGAEIFSSNKVG